MKKLWGFLIAGGALALVADPAMAQEAAAAGAVAVAAKSSYYVAAVFSMCIGMGIAAGLCGLAQGRAAAAALEGIARQPSAAGQLFTPMLIGLALIESLAIYMLLIALILLFGSPFAAFTALG